MGFRRIRAPSCPSVPFPGVAGTCRGPVGVLSRSCQLGGFLKCWMRIPKALFLQRFIMVWRLAVPKRAAGSQSASWLAHLVNWPGWLAASWPGWPASWPTLLGGWPGQPGGWPAQPAGPLASPSLKKHEFLKKHRVGDLVGTQEGRVRTSIGRIFQNRAPKPKTD